MRKMTCEFNSVNGINTAVYTRTGTARSYPTPGVLVKKNCPGGKFEIDASVGGSNNYYKLLNPEKYGIKSSGTVYVPISTQYLKYPTPDSVRNQGNSSNSTNNQSTTQSATSPASTSYSQGLDDQIYEYLQSKRIQDLISENTRIFGMPFQFTNIADNRAFNKTNKLDYGRKYLENIIAEAPIIYVTPGLPNYMPDADQKVKDQIDSFIKTRSENSANNIDDSTLATILNSEQRYYGFVSAYAEYMRYVNLLCRVCAHYMGIADRKVPDPKSDKKYGEYDWGRWTNVTYEETEAKEERVGIFSKIAGAFQDAIDTAVDKISDELFGEYKYIKYYVDPSSSFSESASNSSQSSQIASLFDSLESIVKEVGFFSNGNGVLSGVTDFLKTSGGDLGNSVSGVLDGSVSTGLSNIIGNASHVISGSNIIFPELWGDSSYGKSYSFTINLISPYGDEESIYLNIIVPLMHILAFSMPRQTTANSFGSPFLVKIFAKGWFSCDLGMVESVSIEKDPSSWNVYGLPNEVKVTISVKDLYSNLTISKASTPGLFFSNQGLIEFLAVTCGLNITQGDIGLKIETIVSTIVSTITDMPSNVYDNIIQRVRNGIEGWFKITR